MTEQEHAAVEMSRKCQIDILAALNERWADAPFLALDALVSLTAALCGVLLEHGARADDMLAMVGALQARVQLEAAARPSEVRH